MTNSTLYTNLAHFCAFKGIYVESSNTYHLCDFYYSEEDQQQGVYHVNIMFNKERRQGYRFHYSNTKKQWACDTPEALEQKLSKDLIDIIQVLEQKRIANNTIMTQA
jgi:hypothetical protein